jgi:hypothetical protein
MLLGGCGVLHTDAAPSCPTDRTVRLSSQADVAAFATCETARGIAIRTGATVDVSSLHALTTISGDLVIGPTVGVDVVTLSELREVGGAIIVADNGSLHGLALPRLEKAGRISIEANVSLQSIALPRLAEVTGGVDVSDNHDLEVFDAQALTRVGGDLVVANHPELTVVELGSLKAAAAVRFENDPKITPDVVEAVRAGIAAAAN